MGAKRLKSIDIIKQQLDLYLSNPQLVKEQRGWTQEQYTHEVDLLEQKIVASKRGKSSRLKGGSYERDVAKKFKEKLGIELVRSPMSGGFSKSKEKSAEYKGDIVLLDMTKDFKLHIECKNHKSWSLPSWIRQAEEDSPEGKVPVIIFHRRQLNVEGKREQEVGDYITLPLDMFLDIVDRDKVIVPRVVKKMPKRRK